MVSASPRKPSTHLTGLMRPQPGSHIAPRKVGEETRCATSSASSHSTVGDAQRVERLQLLADARLVGGRRRHLEEARALEVAVELVLANRCFERVDGAFQIVVRRTHALIAVACAHGGERGSEQRHHEAGVAPAGAETAGFGLEDHDVQRRLGTLQVIGGGETGVAAADDGDVGELSPASGGAGSLARLPAFQKLPPAARASTLIPSPERSKK